MTLQREKTLARAPLGAAAEPDVRDPIAIAASLGAAFADGAAALDAMGVFPHENIRALGDAGLLALTAPAELGGGGAGLGVAVDVIREIARGEPATALILSMQYINLATLPGGRWPEAIQRKVISDAVSGGGLINALRVEPDLGSPLRGGLPATVARRTPEGWSISGRKIYSTGIEGLRWAIVWARTDDETPQVGAFLVPAKSPGLTIEKTWSALGMRATGSHDVVLEDVAIPAEFAVDLRAPDEWARDEDQAAWLALLLSTIYTAVAEAARGWLVHFLQNRAPSGLGRPLATLPRIQEAVGEIEGILAVNLRLLRSAAGDVDAGRRLSGAESGNIKVTVTENAIRAVDLALKLTGNHGIASKNPLARHHRDVLCARIHTPQEDSVRLTAGKLALGV